MTWNQVIQLWISTATIIAVILGPVFALYIQNRLNIRREKRDRKLSIFKTLMATRHFVSPLTTSRL